MTTCSATRKDGATCTTPARNSGYCFAHDPALAEKRRAAYRSGGRNKSTSKRLDRLTPASLRPVLSKLYAALDGLEDGSVEPRVGTAMASVASVIVRVHERPRWKPGLPPWKRETVARRANVASKE
jgi:Family of unknown function (DUF5763)